jgi:hypothetical protein
MSCTKVVGQNHAKKRGRALSLPLPDKKIGRATFQSLLQKIQFIHRLDSYFSVLEILPNSPLPTVFQLEPKMCIEILIVLQKVSAYSLEYMIYSDLLLTLVQITHFD